VIRSKRDERTGELLARLVQARLEGKATQREVADRLGRPQSFVSKYESGERRLDVIEFVDVCAALGTDPADLLAALKRTG
jgi:transcriptional regulator with XRE-family HTH domain